MHDIEVHLEDRPGELARVGECLGGAGISIEGGGLFVVAGQGVAHFLVPDGHMARAAIEAAGMSVHAVRDVITQRLDQQAPGQLGRFCRRMADAGINIEVLYSDHDHRLVLVVDDQATGGRVASGWGPADL